MSEQQLKALLSKLNEDSGLREKLLGAANLDDAVAMAKEAGFDVGKADWLEFQAQQTLELSDEELENVAGGKAVDPEVARGVVAAVNSVNKLLRCNLDNL